MKQTALKSLGMALLVVMMIATAFLSGCGSQAEADNAGDTSGSKTVNAPKAWPDVAVTDQSVKTITAKTLGMTVAADVPLVRTTSVEETTPGRYKITVKYNQPGACHTSASNWRASEFGQVAFRMLGVYYKHPAVDLVEIETYATESSSIKDPEQFEKIFSVVVERGRTEGAAWDAMKGHTALSGMATELWVTPRAMNDLAS